MGRERARLTPARPASTRSLNVLAASAGRSHSLPHPAPSSSEPQHESGSETAAAGNFGPRRGPARRRRRRPRRPRPLDAGAERARLWRIRGRRKRERSQTCSEVGTVLARAPRPWRLRSSGGRASCDCSRCSSGGRRGLTSRRPAAGRRWWVRGLCTSRAVGRVQQVQQRADLEVVEGGAAQMRAAVDLVTVTPSDLGSLEVSLGDKVGHDPLSGALSDADLLCEVTGPAVGVASDAQQNVGVVAEEHPAGRFVGRSLHDEIYTANFLARSRREGGRSRSP